ncbi:MAG: hypothetical protein OER85_07300, partial [Gammaproteobacteria bacterium]|nr:hypothetical protein [Gammaproteobacteria bacterium]
MKAGHEPFSIETQGCIDSRIGLQVFVQYREVLFVNKKRNRLNRRENIALGSILPCERASRLSGPP